GGRSAKRSVATACGRWGAGARRCPPPEKSFGFFDLPTRGRLPSIHMDQDEPRQDEEELDPEISLGDKGVENEVAAIAVALAEMIEHQDQRRERARARQCSDLLRS